MIVAHMNTPPLTLQLPCLAATVAWNPLYPILPDYVFLVILYNCHGSSVLCYPHRFNQCPASVIPVYIPQLPQQTPMSIYCKYTVRLDLKSYTSIANIYLHCQHFPVYLQVMTTPFCL